MDMVNIHEAKTHLSRLLERVEAGESVIIARAGKPVAVLGPYREIARPRKLGTCRGKITIADDFDALPDDIVAAFARGEAPPLEPPADHDYKAPSLARAEWEHINRVLSDAGGNISEAARRLGIHRRSLQRKLQKYPPNK